MDQTELNAKMAKLYAVGLNRGIAAKIIKDKFMSTAAVTYAENNSGSDPLLPWQMCSGFAHGRLWAYLGVSEKEFFETTDPEVFKIRMTNSPERLLYPALRAFALMNEVVELFDKRRSSYVRG